MNIQNLQTLFRYNQWANNRVLQKAAKLTAEQLTAPSNLAGENIYHTLIHVYDAEWSWRVACQTGSMPGVVVTADNWPNFTAFKQTWQEEMEQMLTFVKSLADEQLEQPFEYIWTKRAKPRQQTLWHLLFHIANHGTHHRAEIGRELDKLGHSPKNLDFVIWASRQAKTK
jgi:uncharacterized damage-inducible protein DinB